MKIVSIVWFKILPAKFGGQKGIATFNQYLAKMHPLVCICAANNEPARHTPYKVLPVLAVGKKQFLFPSSRKKIRQIAVQEKPTHIILEHPYHGIAAVKACKATGAKLIVHSHNIESQRFRQAGKWGWRLLASYEKWVHRRANLNLFKTAEDKNYAVKHFGLLENKCMLVPVGAEKPVKNADAPVIIRQRHSIPAHHKLLLFAGTLDYHPNAEAVTSIYKQLAPLLSARSFSYSIVICGRNKKSSFRYLENYTHPHVIMAGEVTDIENYFCAADVFINPVQSGGGIQTKNIDAIAAGLNVVCFGDRLNGIREELCRNKLFTVKPNDWEGFANQTIAACQHQRDTPAAFFEHYNWENITKNVADRISQL